MEGHHGHCQHGPRVFAVSSTHLDLYKRQTLKGLQILEPLGTDAKYMTESYAEKFGLTPNDINQVNMEWASAFQAFQTGEGDLTAMNPPYSYQMDELGYKKVCSFEDVTGVNMCDGTFARGEVVKKRPEDVKKFVKCIVRAMDDLQDPKLRKEYTIEFYTKNGQDFSEDDLAKEIEDRDYIGSDYICLLYTSGRARCQSGKKRPEESGKDREHSGSPGRELHGRQDGEEVKQH